MRAPRTSRPPFAAEPWNCTRTGRGSKVGPFRMRRKLTVCWATPSAGAATTDGIGRLARGATGEALRQSPWWESAGKANRYVRSSRRAVSGKSGRWNPSNPIAPRLMNYSSASGVTLALPAVPRRSDWRALPWRWSSIPRRLGLGAAWAFGFQRGPDVLSAAGTAPWVSTSAGAARGTAL